MFLSLCVALTMGQSASAQAPGGKVVINEFMPWPSNACAATSEFVELLNFGPLAVNIGCYILTDGDYSITIPPNTILQPGQYYLISGQTLLPINCGNIDSAVHADLNWNTCGCTSGSIPTTGDGWLTDGGSASEQVVLLDASLNVVDAVVRDITLKETSSTITTSSVSGGCGAKVFDLDAMTINYEMIGSSAGRANSFARRLDGDCDWVKQPSISAHATNNTHSGGASEVTYELNIVEAMDCTGAHGSIDIFVKFTRDYAEIFPMKYTIIRDSNGNNAIDANDEITIGYDSVPPNISIDGLVQGMYSITLESSKGCFLATFQFSILNCGPVLPVRLVYFKRAEKTATTQAFEWKLADVEYLSSVVLESSADGRTFSPERTYKADGSTGTKVYRQSVPYQSAPSYYRLRLVGIDGKVTFSQVLNSDGLPVGSGIVWPNPAASVLHIDLDSRASETRTYQLTNGQGVPVRNGQFILQPGANRLTLPLGSLPAGVYQLQLGTTSTGAQPISFRFVKQ
ncbi:MAG: type sorting protein [Flaviaesturariibacter sp.]|nr:type sorting protein [Flaviaesturariibacter sp.]